MELAFFNLKTEYIPLGSQEYKLQITNEKDFVEFIYQNRESELYVLNLNFLVPLLEEDLKVKMLSNRTVSIFNKKLYDLHKLFKSDDVLITDDNIYEREKAQLLMIKDRYGYIPKQSINELIYNEIEADEALSKKMQEYYNKMCFDMVKSKDKYRNEDYFRNFSHQGLHVINTNYKCKRLNTKVYHCDQNSAYLGQLCNKVFPISAPLELSEQEFNIYRNTKLLYLVEGNFTITKYKLDGINPYIDAIPFQDEPGKIYTQKPLKLNTPYHLYLTNLDLKIFDTAYEYEFEYIRGFSFAQGKLPTEFTDLVKKHFNEKQEMKKIKWTPDFDKIFYDFKKSQLVRMTGMLSQKKIANKKFHNKYHWNIFWAIFTTAWQRFDIWQEILKLGDSFLYSNVDSVFALEKPDMKVGYELGESEYQEHELFIMSSVGRCIFDNEISLGGIASEAVDKFIAAEGVDSLVCLMESRAVFPEEYFPKITFSDDHKIIKSHGVKV